MIEIRNAKITGTMLGYEDHGIMTCMIYTESDGSGQGFGGWSFGGRKKDSVYGIAFIKKVLEIVGVDTWEDLKGKYIRVEADFAKIHKIGNILKDEWFDPTELAEKLKVL